MILRSLSHELMHVGHGYHNSQMVYGRVDVSPIPIDGIGRLEYRDYTRGYYDKSTEEANYSDGHPEMLAKEKGYGLIYDASKEVGQEYEDMVFNEWSLRDKQGFNYAIYNFVKSWENFTNNEIGNAIFDEWTKTDGLKWMVK